MYPANTSRFSVGVFLTLAFAAGCASNGKKIGIRPEAVGAYRFTEHAGEDMDLEGIFVVEPDSVSIDAAPGPCRYQRERASVLAITYICGDVTYVFDKSDPVRKATYSATVRLQKKRQVCARYVVNSTGRSVCAEYRSEIYFVDARRSGYLRPQRMADDDPNHPGL
jgi:hypothetical protein